MDSPAAARIARQLGRSAGALDVGLLRVGTCGDPGPQRGTSASSARAASRQSGCPLARRLFHASAGVGTPHFELGKHLLERPFELRKHFVRYFWRFGESSSSCLDSLHSPTPDAERSGRLHLRQPQVAKPVERSSCSGSRIRGPSLASIVAQRCLRVGELFEPGRCAIRRPALTSASRGRPASRPDPSWIRGLGESQVILKIASMMRGRRRIADQRWATMIRSPRHPRRRSHRFEHGYRPRRAPGSTADGPRGVVLRAASLVPANPIHLPPRAPTGASGLPDQEALDGLVQRHAEDRCGHDGGGRRSLLGAEAAEEEGDPERDSGEGVAEVVY